LAKVATMQHRHLTKHQCPRTKNGAEGRKKTRGAALPQNRNFIARILGNGRPPKPTPKADRLLVARSTTRSRRSAAADNDAKLTMVACRVCFADVRLLHCVAIFRAYAGTPVLPVGRLKAVESCPSIRGRQRQRRDKSQ
jgi:hypothetical protein